MTARADILAGRAVILVNIQDTIDAQLRTIRGKMRAFTNSISEIGGDLFRGGLAGSIGSALPVKSFTDFQDSMLFLQAKLKDTGVDVQQLEKYIRHLGRTTSFTSKEVAEGAAVLAQAGLGERVQAALLPTLDLARSERVDMETAGRILANTMMAFAIPSEKAAETASKLTTATRLGTTDLVLMAESLKYLQTTARSLNMGFEETLGLVVQLSNIGSRGSIAGTSLNAALGNLAAKPIQLKEKLGITFTPEEVQDTVKMLAKIRDATKDMDALERKAVMSSLFNIRGERAFQGAILAGLDELQKNIDLIKASSTEARITSELLDSRLGGVWRRAKSAFEEMGLAIGETTEGPLTKFGNAAQKVFEDLSHLATVNPKIVQTLLIIPPAAIAAGAGLLLLSTAMSKVIMLIGPLLSANAVIFKTIAAVVGTNVKIIKSGFDSLLIGGLYLNKNQGPDIPFLQGITAGFRFATASLQNFYTQFLRVSQRISGSPFRVPWMDWGRQGRGPTQTFPFFRRLGVDPSVTFGQGRDLPEQMGASFVRAIHRSGGLIVRPFRDLPEAPTQTARTTQALNRLGGLILRPFRDLPEQIQRATRSTPLLGRNPAGFLNYFGTGITRAVFRGFTIVEQRQRLLTDNRRSLSIVPVVRAISTAVERGFQYATARMSARNLLGDNRTGLRRFGTDIAFATRAWSPGQPVPPELQRLIGGQTRALALRGQTDIALRNMASINRGAMIDGRVTAGGAREMSSWGKAGMVVRKVLFQIMGGFRRFVPLFTGAFRIAGKTLSGIGSLMRTVFRGVIAVDWVRTLHRGFMGLGRTIVGILRVVSKLRYAFTLPGLLVIGEILLLFGDKIPIVKDILEGLGNAFKNVFGNIGQTLKNLGPSLSLIGDGIRNMFTGDSMLGVQKLKAGFQDIANIISTGLNHAWQQFVADIKPGVDLIKEALQGVIATFNLAVDLLGNIFGGIVSGGKLVLSGEGGFIDQIKSLFSQENRQEVYKFIGGFLAEMTKGILSLVAFITRTALEIKFALFSMVGYVQHAMAVLVEGYASAPHALTGLSDKDQQRLFMQSMRMRGSGDEFLKEVADNRFSSISALNEDLKSRTRSIDQSLGEFLEAINKATTGLTPTTAEAKATADAAALAARFRPSAIAIGNALGRPLAALSSFFLPGSLRPRQPVLTVPETGRQIGGGRGFNIMSTAEMQEAALSLMEGLKKAFGSQTPEPPALAEAKVEAAKIGQAVKAVVGDFESTRGQKIQFRSEKLQEKTNEILDAIQAGVEPLAGLLREQPRFA